jgi:1-acyl-sn-glycerol-3-phosphate acyltransferase
MLKIEGPAISYEKAEEELAKTAE